jgi:hypothetical protein
MIFAMRRPIVLVALFGAGALYTLWLFLQTPGSLNEVLAHPLHALLGTQEQLNSTLLEVSETAEPVRAAGRRLLKPLGIVRLVRTYSAPDSDTTKKP